VTPREKAWIEATDAWLAGDDDRSLAIHEKLIAEWPRDLLAGKLGQLLAFNHGDAEALLRIGEHLFAANRENHYAWGMYAFGSKSAIGSTRPRRMPTAQSRYSARTRGASLRWRTASRRTVGWSRAWHFSSR